MTRGFNLEQFEQELVDILMVKVGSDILGGIFQFGPAESWYMVEQEIENIAAMDRERGI